MKFSRNRYFVIIVEKKLKNNGYYFDNLYLIYLSESRIKRIKRLHGLVTYCLFDKLCCNNIELKPESVTAQVSGSQKSEIRIKAFISHKKLT
jgi:hypothetical protein